jgi:hypothetical protein
MSGAFPCTGTNVNQILYNASSEFTRPVETRASTAAKKRRLTPSIIGDTRFIAFVFRVLSMFITFSILFIFPEIKSATLQKF